MAEKVKIVALAGSKREGSFNHRALAIAAEGARQAGAEVTLVDLREFEMPLFDQEIESAGTPESVLRLKEIFKESAGILIASPEYNGSFTPLLKNTIDWLSRPSGGDPALAAFSGKTAALLSASPGGLGGLRGLVHVRAVLGGIGVLVLPQQVAVSAAHEAFNDQGAIVDPKRHESLVQLGKSLVETAARLSNT